MNRRDKLIAEKIADKWRKDMLEMLVYGFILGVCSTIIYYIFAK